MTLVNDYHNGILLSRLNKKTLFFDSQPSAMFPLPWTIRSKALTDYCLAQRINATSRKSLDTTKSDFTTTSGAVVDAATPCPLIRCALEKHQIALDVSGLLLSPCKTNSDTKDWWNALKKRRMKTSGHVTLMGIVFLIGSLMLKHPFFYSNITALSSDEYSRILMGVSFLLGFELTFSLKHGSFENSTVLQTDDNTSAEASMIDFSLIILEKPNVISLPSFNVDNNFDPIVNIPDDASGSDVTVKEAQAHENRCDFQQKVENESSDKMKSRSDLGNDACGKMRSSLNWSQLKEEWITPMPSHHGKSSTHLASYSRHSFEVPSEFFFNNNDNVASSSKYDDNFFLASTASSPWVVRKNHSFVPNKLLLEPEQRKQKLNKSNLDSIQHKVMKIVARSRKNSLKQLRKRCLQNFAAFRDDYIALVENDDILL